MAIPTELIPVLERVRCEIPGRNVPLAFWQIDDGRQILEGFLSLASQLRLDGVELTTLPTGYEIIEVLFGWESECQSEGWGAFENVGEDEFTRICELYEVVGISPEASSLQKQMTVYRSDPENIEELVAAAEASRHPLSGDLDRLEYLTQYLCDNAEALLGVHA